MIKELPIDKLHVTRSLSFSDEQESLAQSIAVHGQRIPILVNTSMVVIDGWTRLEIAKSMGRTTIQCEVTNDYLRSLDNLRRAHEDHHPRMQRVLELYWDLQPIGDAWVTKTRGEFRTGKPRIGGAFEGEKELRLGHRMRFSEAMGLNKSWLNERMEFLHTVDRVSALSPEMKGAALEVQAFINEYDGAYLGAGGARLFLNNLGQAPPSDVPALMERWRARQLAKIAKAVETQRIEARTAEREKKVKPARVRLPDSMKQIGDVISSLEGVVLAFQGIEFPDMEPEVQAQLAKRMVDVRRKVYKFAKNITQKGTEK